MSPLVSPARSASHRLPPKSTSSEHAARRHGSMSARAAFIQRGILVMRVRIRTISLVSLLFAFSTLFTVAASRHARAAGNSGSISGTVTDPSGAAVPGATVQIQNPVSGLDRTTTTDPAGAFQLSQRAVQPVSPHRQDARLLVCMQDVDVRSVVPTTVALQLKVAGSATTVTVEGGERLVRKRSDVSHRRGSQAVRKIAPRKPSSSVSSLVTLSTPGVAADSNGLFHGLGDHAENSFSVDGQPITDQQSKVFSNQIPLDSIQSLEVISGAPPAEFGDKTSFVIKVTTRSGQGVTTPHGSISSSYGSFGTPNGLRPRLRRRKMGQLHRGKRTEQRPLP